MSTYGRAQDALWDLLYGYELYDGSRVDGPLASMDPVSISVLVNRILDVIGPMFEDLGRRSAGATDES